MKKQKNVRERYVTAHVMVLSEDLGTILEPLHPEGFPAPDFETEAVEIVKSNYAPLAEIRHGKTVRVVVDVIADQIIDPHHFNH